MPPSPLPKNEKERLAALERVFPPGDPADPTLDSLARLAARVADAPIGLVTLLWEKEQTFAACHGLCGVSGTDRRNAFCGYTILGEDILEVPDATADPRFADNPLVTDEPHIRFYAGVPIKCAKGFALGSLCVISDVPKDLTDGQRESLREIADTVERLIRDKRVERDYRKQIEAEKDRLRDFAATVSDWFWECDSELTMKLMESVGAERHRIRGSVGKLHNVLAPNTHELPDTIREAVDAKRGFAGVRVPMTYHGEPRIYAISAMPVTEDGRFAGYRGTAKDVTAEVEREKTRFQRERLESLGQLAGGVAHELNNILLPIRMMAETGELALLDAGAEEEADDMRTIQRNVDAASRIVSDILNHSRKAQDEAETDDLAASTESAVKFAKGMLPSSATVSFLPREGARPIRAAVGATDLGKIVTNLVKNACQASSAKGHVRVTADTVRLHASRADRLGLKMGTYACVRVEDDGVGMTEEQKRSAFEPFFTTKEPGQGIGLGMWVVYRAVSDACGALEIESEPGNGTTVTVFLPCA